MSRTYEILCHLCKERLWIGQGQEPVKPFRLYTDEKHIITLDTFLYNHRGCRLGFQESEQLSVDEDDYKDLSDYEDD